MERTVATCSFQGHRYDLKPRTLKIQRMQEDLATIARRYKSGEITMEGALGEQLDFINATVSNSPFAGIPMDELDVDDVSVMCSRIISGYDAKLNAEKVRPMYDAIAAMSKGKKKKKKHR